MVNRNAARHLLFVVSILLCFFIYMGYRMRAQNAGSEVGDMSATTELASYTPDSIGYDAPGSTMPTSPLRPDDPIASLPSVISGDDNIWVPSARGEDLSLVPPAQPSAPSQQSYQALPIPEAAPHAEAITGLIPAASQESVQPASPPATNSLSTMPVLPPPGAEALPGRLEPEAYSSPTDYLPLPSSGLKPPQPQDSAYQNAPEESGFVPGLILPPPGATSVGTYPPPPSESVSYPVDAPPSYPVAQPVQPPPSLTPMPSPSSVTPPAPPPVERMQPGTTSRTGLIRPPETPEPGGNRFAPPPPQSSPGTVPSAFRPNVPEPIRSASEPSESLRIYLVRPGDSLSSIAAQELGSASMADNIFLLNRDVIADPDHLLVGIKIRLPIRDGGFGYGDGSAASVGSPSSSGRRPTYGLGRTHIVARGDTLSSIALRYYGNSSAWRFLYEANKQVVPNPNTLSVGTELTIPPYDN